MPFTLFISVMASMTCLLISWASPPFLAPIASTTRSAICCDNGRWAGLVACSSAKIESARVMLSRAMVDTVVLRGALASYQMARRRQAAPGALGGQGLPCGPLHGSFVWHCRRAMAKQAFPPPAARKISASDFACAMFLRFRKSKAPSLTACLSPSGNSLSQLRLPQNGQAC